MGAMDCSSGGSHFGGICDALGCIVSYRVDYLRRVHMGLYELVTSLSFRCQ